MKTIFKKGLKLFSTNTDLIEEALSVYAQGLYDYIELSVIPGSFMQTSCRWRTLDIPFVIHAPHSGNGINIARREMESKNIKDISEAKRFADMMNCDAIILHGGNDGDIEEAIRQIKILNDKRMLIENKPKMGLHGEICLGYSPEEIAQICASGYVGGTVLDFGHAIYAANSMKTDAKKTIEEFNLMCPKIYHLSDGDKKSEKDKHINLGNGDFDLEKLISFVTTDAMVTLETPRSNDSGLQDFIRDIGYLQNLLS